MRTAVGLCAVSLGLDIMAQACPSAGKTGGLGAEDMLVCWRLQDIEQSHTELIKRVSSSVNAILCRSSSVALRAGTGHHGANSELVK